ncbi:MAG: chorismate mutase [Oscillospiraceae bacterium]|nr:chorismate mutase [Oscillospiraceae bacterium]
MTPKEKLEALRGEIDTVNKDMLALFQKRQRISGDIAAVKEEGNLAVTDIAREQRLLASAAALADVDKQGETAAFMRTLISLSKLRQNDILHLTHALDFPEPSPLPAGAAAYQGIAGAWGEHAAHRLFPGRELFGQTYFEDVFDAVKSGKAAIGVLPIENSRTGAIGEVYDLLRRNSCYIVGSMWVTVSQCLIGMPGAAAGDVREVLSHPEGFNQCRLFLKNRNWELTNVRNTAVAAVTVRERGDIRYAAIGSRRAAEVNGLSVISPDIADDSKNRTRFIAIAAEPAYAAESNIISVTFSVSHQSGALVAALSPFQLAGLNLTRIESRPVSVEKYRFFADIEGNIKSGAARDAIAQAAMQTDYFEVLGCYSETQEQPL